MSKVYKNKKDGNLYVLYYVSPPKYLGSWYEAHPLRGGPAKKITQKQIDTDYVLHYHSNTVVQERTNRVPPIC